MEQEKRTEKVTGPRTDRRDNTRVLPEQIPAGVSPVDPTIGRTVHYYPTNTELIHYGDLAQRGGAGLQGIVLGKTPIAAVIVSVSTKDRVNLRLFLDGPVMPPLVKLAMFSDKPIVGRWSWPPMVKRRVSTEA